MFQTTRPVGATARPKGLLHALLLHAALLLISLPAYSQWNGDTLTITATQLDDIEVVARRVEQVTTNHQIVNHDALNRDNTGQNLPYLLQQTPALITTSDDGLGVGYTYFRVRGTDHTRINMTVNDVPLNDAESQTVFWVNMTDMANSLSSIEVQRGVGTSTNGSASFGASLNMSTLHASDTLSHVTLGFNGGMYKTFKEMIQAHVVLPDKRWQMNARFSKVNSDGFLYRTASDLYSYHADLGFYGHRTQVVASVFGGSEHTGMGWDGVTYDHAYGKNGADRRYNPAGEYYSSTGDTLYYKNQTDNYAQQHAQLNIKHRFNYQWTLNLTAHYTHGGGYYEQYEEKNLTYFGLLPYINDAGKKIKKTDAIYRKNLNNHFFGLIASAKYVNEHVDVQFGAAANDYIGQHYGNLLWLKDPIYTAKVGYMDEYYRSKSNKVDANAYAKVNWRVLDRNRHRLSLYADLQYRYIRYEMSGQNSDAYKQHAAEPFLLDLPITKHYHFFNPKAGITYEHLGHTLYGSFAIANREPSRDNFTENVLFDSRSKTYIGTMPQSERLYDYELGYTYSHSRFSVGANLYFMDYDNQLVLTGKQNDVGKQQTTNVKDSYRMGVELTGGVQIASWLRWDANLVISRNKIKNFRDTITVVDPETWDETPTPIYLSETTIAFAPAFTFGSLFQFDIAGFHADLQTNVVSKQYLDNRMDESATLRAYSVTNLNLQYQLPIGDYGKTASTRASGIPNIRLLCQINNLFNAKYASNGGSDSYVWTTGGTCWPWYYAQAGINVHAGFIVNW